MVSLVDGAGAVKMGKRAGTAIDLDTVIADIGPDATRILSLMSTLDQAATFDLATVREQSVENPVFYVQMASARIGGVGRKAAERGVVRAPLAAVDLSLLTHPRDLELMRCLEELPEVVADAAITRAPTKITTWVRRLAACFHGFYHDCPILAEDIDPGLTQARLWLVEGARIGLAIGLGLLGVAAPEAM
jgi:arginyl-tRNA synthetase